jgi:hypothetical protein
MMGGLASGAAKMNVINTVRKSILSMGFKERRGNTCKESWNFNE